MRFGALLRDVAGALEAPHRARVRFLEELSADLEDLYAALRAEGVPAAEARRRAERALAPSPEVARALARVHRPLWLRLVERFSDRTRTRLERMVLASVTVCSMALAVSGLAATGLMRGTTVGVVVVGGIGGAAAALSVRALFRLHAAGGRAVADVRAALWMLPAAAVGALAAAMLATLVGLARAASAIQALPVREAAIVLDWLRDAVGVGSLALLVALGCAQAWILLLGRVSRMEVEQAAVVGRTLRTLEGGRRCSNS